MVRSKVEIETEANGREKTVTNEIPYMVNKVELIKNIVALVEEKKVEGIAHINDESDREGMRIVIDIKRDANSNVVLNKLFQIHSPSIFIQRKQYRSGSWPSTYAYIYSNRNILRLFPFGSKSSKAVAK